MFLRGVSSYKASNAWGLNQSGCVGGRRRPNDSNLMNQFSLPGGEGAGVASRSKNVINLVTNAVFYKRR